MPYISKRKVGNPNKIEQKEANVRHNNKWSKYYHNKQWKLLREWQITNYPLCYDCALNGRSVPAEEYRGSKKLMNPSSTSLFGKPSRYFLNLSS